MVIWFRHGGGHLIARMSRSISSFFIVHGVISKDEREVYNYSFEILLATVLNFLVVVILAIVSRTIPQTVFYLLGFLPLRQIAGGYHAKTHFRCLLILIFSYIVFLVLLHFATPA